jgi:hypothetical protein
MSQRIYDIHIGPPQEEMAEELAEMMLKSIRAAIADGNEIDASLKAGLREAAIAGYLQGHLGMFPVMRLLLQQHGDNELFVSQDDYDQSISCGDTIHILDAEGGVCLMLKSGDEQEGEEGGSEEMGEAAGEESGDDPPPVAAAETGGPAPPPSLEDL